jgi:hypothetical protein
MSLANLNLTKAPFRKYEDLQVDDSFTLHLVEE